MEGNVVNNKKGNTLLVVFLLIVIIGLIGYIVYDKFISKNNSVSENNTQVESTILESNNVEESVSSLSGKSYYNDYENKEYYLKFTNSTDYVLVISKRQNSSGNTSPYTSKGTYVFDGEKITLSDSKINVIYKNDAFYINYNNYKTEINTSNIYYDVYLEIDEFSKIKTSVQKYVIDTWNNENTEKMTNADTTVEWCYANSDNNHIGCSTNTRLYFEHYSKVVNDEEILIGMDPDCDDEKQYCDNWSFYALEKTNNQYKTISSYTGM